MINQYTLYECLVKGQDYPERIVDHKETSARNEQWMAHYRQELARIQGIPDPCVKSSSPESRQLVYSLFGANSDAYMDEM